MQYFLLFSLCYLEALYRTLHLLYVILTALLRTFRYSAIGMTCRAPKTNICGAGSTLSEYELYFNYAREKFPGNLISSNQFYLYCPTCPTLRVPFLS